MLRFADYEVVSGLSETESKAILAKLSADDFPSNETGEKKNGCWVLPEGLKDYSDLACSQQFVNSKDKKAKKKPDNEEDKLDEWEACLLGNLHKISFIHVCPMSNQMTGVHFCFHCVPSVYQV